MNASTSPGFYNRSPKFVLPKYVNQTDRDYFIEVVIIPATRGVVRHYLVHSPGPPGSLRAARHRREAAGDPKVTPAHGILMYPSQAQQDTRNTEITPKNNTGETGNGWLPPEWNKILRRRQHWSANKYIQESQSPGDTQPTHATPSRTEAAALKKESCQIPLWMEAERAKHRNSSHSATITNE